MLQYVMYIRNKLFNQEKFVKSCTVWRAKAHIVEVPILLQTLKGTNLL